MPRVAASNEHNRLIRQLSVWVAAPNRRVPPASAALPIHIANIVQLCPQLHVCWVATQAVITLVHDNRPVVPLTRRNRTVRELPCDTMRQFVTPQSASHSNDSIPGDPRLCHPRPTLIRGTAVNFRPEPLFVAPNNLLYSVGRAMPH